MPRVGERVAGRYVLHELLGQGGGGMVFGARDEVLGRAVALKFIPEGDASAWAEARLASTIAHEGFPRVYDLGQMPGWQYLVMELVRGETARDRLERQGALPPYEAIGIASQVGEALEAAHGAGVVHCDVKPSNVVLGPDGRARLVDFGAARPLDGQVDGGDVALSPLYVAPEVALGGAADARTDVYALGALAYTLLAGRPPFTGRDAESTVQKRLTEDPQPPSAYSPAVPAAVDAAVLRALERDPARRFQSAAAFVAALRRAHDDALEVTRRVPTTGLLSADRLLSATRLPLRGLPWTAVRTRVAGWSGSGRWAPLLALVAGLALLAGTVWVAAPYVAPEPFCVRGERPGYTGPLADLSARLGGTMGAPKDCPHDNPENGDRLQNTQSGLAFVRKRSGAATFTNGSEHWALTERGLLYWTGDAVDPPRGAVVVPPGKVRPD